MRHTLRHLFVFTLTMLPACGSSSSDGGCDEGPTSSISLVAVPDSATVKVGASATFVAKIARCDGLSPIPEARWASGNPAVATIDAVTGVTKGVAPGKAQLSATYGPGTAFATIDVVP